MYWGLRRSSSAAKEREIERGLLTHLRDLLLELGRGFSFVGSQVPLTVDGQTFYIDLLFYHVRLHCYFVFELKVGAFQPEHAGKLGFYLAAARCEPRSRARASEFSCARAGAVPLWNLPSRTPISRLVCPPIR
jgi:hypothetical protein